MKRAPPRLFVCYARRDEALRDELLAALAELEQLGLLSVWVDQEIPGGDEWRDKIERGIASSALAIVLASKASMGSDFIRDVELPRLLGAREAGQLRLHVVHLEASHAARLDVALPSVLPDGKAGRALSLAAIQYAHPQPTLAALDPAERARAWSAVCDAIERDARIIACTGALLDLARCEGGVGRIERALGSVLGGAPALSDEPEQAARQAVELLLDQVVALPEVTTRITALLDALLGDEGTEGREDRGAPSRRRRVLLGSAALLIAPLLAFGAVASSGWALVHPRVVGEARCEGGDGIELQVRNLSGQSGTMRMADVALACAEGETPAHLFRGPRGGTCSRGVGESLPAVVPAWSLRPRLARLCVLPPALGCASGATLTLSWEGDGRRTEPQEVRCGQ